jgi:hypothetical protein
LNEICTLSNHVQSTNLLQFQQKNDLKTTLVRVPQSSNELSFRRNVNRTKCADKILDAFIPSTKKESVLLDDDEDAITDQDDVIYCLLKYLGTKYDDQFALAAKDLGLPVHKEKMPPARVAAMMEEANLGSKARIVVAKHFNALYRWNFLPPRTQLEELSVSAIKPTVSTLKIEGITYTYWVKDVGNVLAHLVDPYLKQGSAD